MERRDFRRYKVPVTVFAALFIVVGLWGAADVTTHPPVGYWTGTGHVVAGVVPGSAADTAGIKVNDRVRSIDNIPVGETSELAKMPAPRVGETHSYVVDRDGETLSLAVVIAPPGMALLMQEVGVALVGWCFLLCGVWALLRRPTRATWLLALTGLFMGFGPLPRVNQQAVSQVLEFLVNISGMLGFALLLHFLLVFPRPKAMIQKKDTAPWLYLLALLWVLFYAAVRFFELPEGVSTAFSFMTPLVALFYMASSLGAVLNGYLEAGPSERRGAGLTAVLVAAIIGLVPSIAQMALLAFAPGVSLPGAQYYVLALVLLPFALARGAVRPMPAPEPRVDAL
jgi:hypothetical protein